jgi:hypothetical protein
MIHPTLSFCIAYNNETSDIKKILKNNLINNHLYAKYIEFAICDFSKKKNLHTWLFKNCRKELKLGYLKYFQADELVEWHDSIAKNRTAIHASKDIIVNIDSGFLIDLESTIHIMKSFIENARTVIHLNSMQEFGHQGHLAVPREYFTLAGGYDESFEPSGYQTIDLLERLRFLGLSISSYQQKNVDYSSFKSSLMNSRYTSAEYNRMLSDNFSKSRNNISNGFLIANDGFI